jgi:hypothetical protein
VFKISPIKKIYNFFIVFSGNSINSSYWININVLSLLLCLECKTPFNDLIIGSDLDIKKFSAFIILLFFLLYCNEVIEGADIVIFVADIYFYVLYIITIIPEPPLPAVEI